MKQRLLLVMMFLLASMAAQGQDLPVTPRSMSYMPEAGWEFHPLTHDQITYYTGDYVMQNDTTVHLLVDLVEDRLELVMPNGDSFEMRPAGFSVFYFDPAAPDRIHFYRDHWRDPWTMNILTSGGQELEAVQVHDEDY